MSLSRSLPDLSQSNADEEHVVERGDTPLLRVTLLGGLQLQVGNRSLAGASWRGRKAAQLVKLLALTPDHALHRAQIDEALWPEQPPATAGNNLRQTLHVARRRLVVRLGLDPAEVLRSRGERVYLYPADRLWTDVEAFEDAARSAHQSNDPASYWAAIDRYGGPLLPEDLYEDWAAARREALAANYHALLSELARLHETRGEEQAALAVLRRIVEVEPADEAAHVQLMRIYARTGRRPLALRQYDQLVHALARTLDTTPEPASQELFTAIKSGRYPPEPTPASVPALSAPSPQLVAPATADVATNLPHTLSSFVGRDRDLAEVSRLLRQHRLVTLTGPGGSGKTRLALEVGWRQLDEQAGAVWLVELASLADPALVAETIADQLGIHAEPGQDDLTALVARLRRQSLLLILDNCEHLIGGCANVVEALLSGCPAIRVLATSRQALDVPSERPWPVPPLPLPEVGIGLAELAANDSVRLLLDRIHTRRPDLGLTAGNAAAVVDICRRLDGLPLALELAASRASVLTLAQLAARLDDALGVLAAGGRSVPDRQRTLRATLDWSYALLDPPEQGFLRRLAVFRGGWTLAAAEAIADATAGDAALDLLSRLSDRSLVQVDLSDDEARYRLLEPVRQYAAELLAESGETQAVQTRHADYYVRFVESIEPELSSEQQVALFHRLDREQDNLRAVLDWALARGDARTMLRLCGLLWSYWGLRWRSAEGIGWINAALSLPEATAYPELRARAALGAGELARRILDFERAAAFLERALAGFRELGDLDGTAAALIYLSGTLTMAGDQAGARRHAEESLTLFQRLGDRQGIARALSTLGEDARLAGDYERAERCYREALALDQAIGDQLGMAIRRHNLGYIALHHGDLGAAAASFREGYEINLALGNRGGPLSFLEGMAACASAAGQPHLATQLYAAWEAQCALPGTEFKLHPPDQAEYDRALTRIRSALDESGYAAAREAGRALTLDVAIARALALAATLTEHGEANDLDTPPQSPLTPRERAVAELVARGLTNGQIAVELGAAERTIDTHVGRILRKLHLRRRHEVAARLATIDAYDGA